MNSKRLFRVPLCILFVWLAAAAFAEGVAAEAANPWKVYPEKLPARADALRFNIDACVEACRRHEDPATKEAWETDRATLATALRRAIGLEPWPEKSPLEARITGQAERDGYTIQNVVFQSFPQFYVTANVYIPKDGKRPLPAIVVTAGHAMDDGKNYDLYRTAQLGLVRQGFLVLAYDPVGQGERKLPGYSHPVSYPAMLVGHTNLRYMLWDSVRALDYLLTRTDVDPKRIGITGNSGGGLNTMYAMPIESRFAAGASFCCLCSYEAWIKDGGNHCICNHLPGICREMEQFQFVGLCAARPFMAGNGEKDPIFPVQGTRDTIRRAEKIYGFYDAADRVALCEAPLAHGWSQPLREKAYGWMNRWLRGQGDGSPVPEPEIKLEDKRAEDLRALKDGKMPADAKSYTDLIREEAQRLVGSYASVPSDRTASTTWAAETRKRLWETLGGKPEGFQSSIDEHGSFAWEGRTVERMAIRTEPGLEVPALLIRSGDLSGATPVVVLLDDAGKEAVRESAVAKTLLDQKIAVLALDVRATGEGKVHENQCASDAIVLGRPLLGQQTWDVVAAVNAISQREDLGPVAVYGRGSLGLVAMLAAATSEQIAGVAVERSLGSLVWAIADPLPQPLSIYAPNILKVGDIPHVAALCSPRPLLWVNPQGSEGTPVSDVEALKLLEPAVAAYRSAGAATFPRIHLAADPGPTVSNFLKTTLNR